jgi:hypothetical protein
MSNKPLRWTVAVLVVVAFFVGAGQVLAKPWWKTCPAPNPDCPCPWYEDTVFCQVDKKNAPVCQYTNPCFARCAGFSDDQCSRALP